MAYLQDTVDEEGAHDSQNGEGELEHLVLLHGKERKVGHGPCKPGSGALDYATK